MAVDAGKVAVNPRGVFSSSATYERLDVVTYQSNTYVALQTTQGNLPTDTSSWAPWVKLDNASMTVRGLVKVDGTSITADADGTIHGHAASGVNSFNGREGDVLPELGDYDATQVDYDASHTVKQMIDSINHENINKPNYNTFYSASRKTNDVNGGNSIGAGVYLLLDDQAAITTGSGVPNGSAFTSSNCTKITGGVLNYIVKPTQITVTRSITPSGSEVFECWRSGNVATLFINNVIYANSYSADTKIATLACKPKTSTRATFYNENLGIIPILISASGDVYLSQYTAGKHIYGSVTFVCNV